MLASRSAREFRTPIRRLEGSIFQVESSLEKGFAAMLVVDFPSHAV
jgi:hypothetical protein